MGSLRIIAGALRGRRLEVPRGSRARPTADRVREALFSILGDAVDGARVLDAYAGTGALGFEALSRGAREVVFIERDPRAAEALRGAASRFGVRGACLVLAGEVARLLPAEATRGGFELILADPPYRAQELEPLLTLATLPGVLQPGGKLVLEREAGHGEPPPGPSGLALTEVRRYGRTELILFLREGAPKTP